jgi:hypothetical protein
VSRFKVLLVGVIRKGKQTKYEEETNMWIETKMDFFKISREERLVFNFKLEELYKSHGKHFEVLTKPSNFFMDNRAIAYMEVNHLENEVNFACGTFWYEEDNLCPVVAMTHELGHYIDLKENFNENYMEYNKQLGVLECEIRAWEHGIEFCKQIGIVERYGQMIFEYAHRCLSSYFNGFTAPRDRRFGFTGRRPSFTEAVQRLQQALGMEINTAYIEEPVKQSDPLSDVIARLEELLGERRNPVGECNLGGLDLETEELTPLERVRKQKAKYRETVKKGMGAKSWEL